jgi:hypothetical protein
MGRQTGNDVQYELHVPVTDGHCRIEAKPGPIVISPEGLIGYSFKRYQGQVSGSSPQTIALELEFAGAVHGSAYDPSGNPVPGSLSVTAVPKSDRNPCVSGRGDLDMLTGYSVTPMAFDETYALVAVHNHSVVVIPNVRVNSRDPLQVHDFRFSEGETVTCTVVDSEGNPVPHAPLHFVYSPNERWSHDSMVDADENGRFVFSDVNFNVPGHYELRCREYILGPTNLERESDPITLTRNSGRVTLVLKPQKTQNPANGLQR